MHASLATRLTFITIFAWLTAGCAGGENTACDEVDCAGHGECQVEGAAVWCECDPDYHAVGLTCELDGADGDADADADDDSPVDADTPRDADGDQDLEPPVDADPAEDADHDESPGLCEQGVVETTFEDFVDGTLYRSTPGLYVSADGAVRSVMRTDLDQDGYPDVVLANFYTDRIEHYDVPSVVHWGAGERTFELMATNYASQGATGWAVADLDADGYVDLLIANKSEAHLTPAASSFLYWGGPGGPDPEAEPYRFEEHGSIAAAIADIDRDGFLDVVFARPKEDDTWVADSVVFWGRAGRTFERGPEFETHGAGGVALGDLNADGYLDIVFAHATTDGALGRRVPSRIYWGPFFESHDDLPTLGCYGVTIADVDSDGWLDLLFANHLTGDSTSHILDSYIYWGLGSSPWFDSTERTELLTYGASGVEVSDLDDDGILDVVFANAYDDVGYETNSFIFWGEGGRVFAGPTPLPTSGAFSLQIADLDQDGRDDILFPNTRDDSGNRLIGSSIYWAPTDGDPRDFTTVPPTILASESPEGRSHLVLGNLYDRTSTMTYFSSLLVLPWGAVAHELRWSAEAPTGTSVSFRLRSGASPEEVSTAEWQDVEVLDDGIASIAEAHGAHQHFQYEVTFELGAHVSEVVLDTVEICTR